MGSQVFGKFHVLAQLAQGRISDIYKVKTTGVAGFEKVQVLKRIHSELSSEQRFISAFAREAQIAVALNHRNVVQVYEFGRVGPDYFLAMEFVEGVDLGRLMTVRDRGHGEIPVGLALHIGAEVAAGLDYAHSKSDYGGGALGVVHGDLSPNHILLSYDGSVKILDFGIARAALERGTAPGSSPVGRAGYMSPEQARGEPAGPRSDIYVLGVLIYELLAGRSPFAGENIADQMRSCAEGFVVPLSDTRPELSPTVLRLLDRALAADPTDRYTHARELVRDVLQIQRAAGEIHNTRTVRDFLTAFVGDSGQKLPPDLAQGAPRPVFNEAPSDAGTKPEIGGDEDSYSTDSLKPPAVRRAGAAAGAADPRMIPAITPTTGSRPLGGGGFVAVASSHPGEGEQAEETANQRPLRRDAADAARNAPALTPHPMPAARRAPLPPAPAPAPPAGSARGSVATASAAVPRTTRPVHPATEARVAPASGATSERKAVVVLHVEAVGVEDISSLMPAGSTNHDIRNDLESVLEGMAYRAGGVVTRSSGGLTVTFGLPAPSEDDHEVAVRYALDALEAAHGAARDVLARAGMSMDGNTPPLSLHAGIRAGTARLRGAADAMTFSLLGDAAETAEALCRLAPPATILVSGPTVQMTRRGYAYREGPAVPARSGTAARAHFLLGARSQAERRRGLRSGGRALVGRDDELARIVAAWHEVVKARAPRGLLVTGPAGIGKSRLVLELAEQIAGDATALQGVCRFFSSGSPYAVWVDLLRDHLGMAASDDPLRVRVRVHDWVKELFPDPPEAEAARNALVEVLVPGSPLGPSGDAARGKTAEERQRFVHRAMVRVMAALGEKRPLLLLLEDVQWMDQSSQDLLGQILERHRGPLLLLATSRPGELPGAFADLPRLELVPLDDDAQRRMLADRLGPARASGPLADELVRKAGGNPFFLSELAEALREAPTADAVEVPVTVRGAVITRVERLSTAAKRILQRAAVVGHSAPASLLEALGGDAEAADALREIESRELLVREPGQVGEPTWAFRQSIVQEVVYDSLNERDRRALHHEVGERLAAVLGPGNADGAAAVARHFERAGETQRAGRFYLTAAHAAASVYANAEALAFYDRAYRELAVDPDLELEILAGKERIHNFMGNAEEQQRLLDATERIARVRQAQSWLAEILVRRSELLRGRGDIESARRAAMEAVEVAVRTDDPVAQGRSEKEMGELYLYAGDIEGALERYRKALRYFETAGNDVQIWRTRHSMGTAYLMAARYADAETEFQRGYEIAERVGDDLGLANTLQALGASSYCTSDWELCLDRFGRAVEIGRRIGDRRSEGVNLSNIGLVMAELGMYDRAAALLAQARAVQEETGGGVTIVDTALWQGLVERRRGDRNAARRYLVSALELAESLGHVYWTVMARLGLALHHVEGTTAADWEKALRAADEAVTQAREASLVHGVIQGQSRAGWALLKLGRLDEARERSREAVESLQQQQIVECSEEEVYFTHHAVLAALGDREHARWLDLASKGLQEKTARIHDPERRESFLRVPLHQEILALAGSAA
jgi:serine/threonine protein kinase/tetratricopeptide (TPR) repeat protein